MTGNICQVMTGNICQVMTGNICQWQKEHLSVCIADISTRTVRRLYRLGYLTDHHNQKGEPENTERPHRGRDAAKTLCDTGGKSTE